MSSPSEWAMGKEAEMVEAIVDGAAHIRPWRRGLIARALDAAREEGRTIYGYTATELEHACREEAEQMREAAAVEADQYGDGGDAALAIRALPLPGEADENQAQCPTCFGVSLAVGENIRDPNAKPCPDCGGDG